MNRSGNTFLYIIMIIAMAIWGLSWTNGKILGDYTGVPTLMLWRFIIAALSMLFVLAITKTEWRIDNKGTLLVLGSAVLMVLYNYFYFTGTKLGAAGAGGVLVTTLNPVLTFILVSIFTRKLPKGQALVGILLGIFGGSILINIWQEGWSAVFKSGNQYFVMCAVSWAFLTVISADIGKYMSVLTYSFWLYVASAFLSLVLAWDAQPLQVFHYDFTFWINLFSVSVGAMAFATTAYFIAATRLGSEKASAFIFTVPVSAMFFSMLILREPLELNILMGGILSIVAVYLINSNKSISPTK